MNIGSFDLVLIPLALLFLLFLIEALVIYFFKLKRFWASLGISAVVNLLSGVVLYFIGSFIVPKLGYEINGFPLPVIALLWWVSVIVDGLLLQLVCRNREQKDVFLASLLMNSLSYLSFMLIVSNSH
jgi:hypothetical protein